MVKKITKTEAAANFENVCSSITKKGFADSSPQADAALFLDRDHVFFERKDHGNTFELMGAPPEQNWFVVQLLRPESTGVLNQHRESPAASTKFWQESLTKSLEIMAFSADHTSLDEYRENNFERIILPAYLALNFGMRGNMEMLKFYADVTPSAIVSLAAIFPDLLVRTPDKNYLQSQTQNQGQGASGVKPSGPNHPNSSAAKIAVETCAKHAKALSDGPGRLKAIQAGGRFVTHYLANRRGLGKYLARYEKKEDVKKHDGELEAAIELAKNKPSWFYDSNIQAEQGSFLSLPTPKNDHEQYADSFLLLKSEKTNVRAMLSDVWDLLHSVVPPDGDERGKEYQAICVAILAVGVSDFGYEMLKRYETIEKRAGKITELVGSILGGLPWGGGIIAAVATVSKAITDAIYEHKADKVKPIKTLGKRITAAFLLDKTDFAGGATPTESERTNSELYTRVLSSIYGIAMG